MATNNLVCVCVGDAYSPDYVKNLYAGAKKHTTVDFDFWVFTDNVDQFSQNLGWHFVELKKYNRPIKGWWYKMEIFKAGILDNADNLYIDLDCVIVGDLSPFWKTVSDKLGICHDFNRQFSRNINLSNSSVMTWQNSDLDWLYQSFQENFQTVVGRYRGDQDLIHHSVENKTWFPREWAMSWRWEIKGGGLDGPNGKYIKDEPWVIPQQTKIVVCHGTPKPRDIPELSEHWHK